MRCGAGGRGGGSRQQHRTCSGRHTAVGRTCRSNAETTLSTRYLVCLSSLSFAKTCLRGSPAPQKSRTVIAALWPNTSVFLCDNDQALARRAIRFASLSQITICVFGSCFLHRVVFLREVHARFAEHLTLVVSIVFSRLAPFFPSVGALAFSYRAFLVEYFGKAASFVSTAVGDHVEPADALQCASH